MHSHDMLVETPVCEADLEDRSRKPGHDGENQCSYCGVGPNGPWYDVHDIMVVRHWTTDSVDEPGGGHWRWYCPDHFRRRTRWWRTSHLAPPRLLPKITHPCAQIVEFGERCGVVAVEPFDGAWFCEKHAAVQRTEMRINQLLHGDDEVDPLLVEDQTADPTP